jgi:hypothetical protein
MSTPDIECWPADPVPNPADDEAYTYEQTAELMAISVTLVERFVTLNLVEPQERKLCDRDLARIAQMLRLRRDLGLNWVGASMVLDMCQEISQLKARLRAYGVQTD